MLVLALQFSRGAKGTAGAAELALELDADDPLPHNGREERSRAYATIVGGKPRQRWRRTTTHQCTN
jgi:hypothetical protein